MEQISGYPQYAEPNDFVRKYIHYSLLRFLTVFRSVGLYVCPGEALRPQYTPEWIRDVILSAAKKSQNHPVIAIRDWGLDSKRFKEVCKDEYDNLYVELKHNIEMILSPFPDPRHAEWSQVVKKHIVNLHEIADVKPFRWGSPRFIHEMVGEWKKIGVDGAEVYGMVSWRWPYALDKLEPQQSAFWPSGKKLLTFERDEIWLKAVGRYLWEVECDARAEEEYWVAWLADKYGDERAGRWLWEWYTVTGPVLPGLQNLTNVNNMNWHPTAVGKEQRVDSILDPVSANTNYPARPVDAHFFARYKKKYGLPDLANRVPLSVADYAERLAQGEAVPDAMTPDNVADLLAALAEESIEIAQTWSRAATEHQDEAARFVTDSQALCLVAGAWQHKVLAALHKRLLQLTHESKHERAFVEHMEGSILVYEELVELTDRTYINATDMVMRLNWHDGLEHFQADAEDQRKFLRNYHRIQRLPAGTYWLEAEEMDGDWRISTKYNGYLGSGYRMNVRSEGESTPLRETVQIERPGCYAVWIRSLLAEDADRSAVLELAGRKLPTTHNDTGTADGEFVWRKSGEVELARGKTEVRLHDVGTGHACPDAVVLTSVAAWTPPREMN